MMICKFPIFRTYSQRNLNNRFAPKTVLLSRKLSWRDMQHLTVLTSKRNSLFDAKNRFFWNMNGKLLLKKLAREHNF